MGNEKLCDKVLFEILKDPDKLSDEALSHIENCDFCKAEFEKIKNMDSLLKSTAPKVPSMKEAVLSKIENEKIFPVTVPTRKHFPIGTISAAAAVLAIGILVYKGDMLNKVNNVENAEDHVYYTNDAAAIEIASSKPGDRLLVADEIFSTYSDQEAVETDSDDTVAETEALPEVYVEEAIEAETEEAASAEPESVTEETAPEESEAVPEVEKSFDEQGVQVDKAEEILLSVNPTISSPSGGNTSGYDPENSKDVMLALPPQNADAQAEGSSGASGGGGATTSTISKSDYVKGILGEITEDTDAKEVFKILYEYYPEGISFETFKDADETDYLAFVSSIENFDLEYNEKGFLAFCGKIFFRPQGVTEIL